MSVRTTLRDAAVALVRATGTAGGWGDVPVLGRKRLSLLENETPPRVLVTVTEVGREVARSVAAGPEYFGYYDLVVGYFSRSVGVAQDETEVDDRAEDVRNAVEILSLTTHGALYVDEVEPQPRPAFVPPLLSDSYDVAVVAFRVRTLEPS